MHLRRTAAAVAVAISSGCGPAVVATLPPAPALLAVVAWNTDAGRGDLSRLAADLERGALSGGHTPGTLVLLLQEAAAADLEAIARPRGWTTSLVAVRALDGGVRGNAIVSSRPLRDARALPLPRERQPRAAAVARLDVAGRELFVVSVHLENRSSWWKGGLLGDTARQRQVQGLLHAIPPDAPGILGGDLNTWLGPTEPAWRSLVERFADSRDWPRSPTFGDRLVLDHLLADLPDGWRMTRRVLTDDYGSDHHPVVGIVFGL